MPFMSSVYDEVNAGLVDGYSSVDNTIEPLPTTSLTELDSDNYLLDTNLDSYRAAELKKKELFRKGKLLYEDNGELANDSNAVIRAKEAANTGIDALDWVLEATENIADYGQGDWLNNSKFKATINGKQYNMDNKDIIGARETTLQDLIQQYQLAENNPNSEYGIYTLRKFDGYNPDGSEKYLYKYGRTKVGADSRYKDQYIQDGYEIVEEKRFAGAEEWEKLWNANEDVLEARALDSGTVTVDGTTMNRDEASGVNFGSGYTELLTKDLLGTDVNKTEEDYKKNEEYSKRLTDIYEAKLKSGATDGVLKALEAGGAKMLVDTADFILDVVTPGDNTWLNKAKKQENVDKFVGYDRTGTTQLLSDAATYWEQGNYLDAIYNAVVAGPETFAESVPLMIGMTVGTGKFTKVAELLDKTNKARKLGKIAEANRAEQIAKAQMTAKEVKAYDKFKDNQTLLTGLNHVAKNYGFYGTVGTMTNNVLDDRIANKIKAGENPDVSIGEVIGTYALQLLLTLPDRIAFADVTGLDKSAQVLRKAFNSLPKEGKTAVAKKIATKALAIAGEAGEEAVQEYTQTWGEILGAQAYINDKSVLDVFENTNNQNEALTGMLGGLGAGGFGAGVSNSIETTLDAIQAKKEEVGSKDVVDNKEEPIQETTSNSTTTNTNNNIIYRHPAFIKDVKENNVKFKQEELDSIDNYVVKPNKENTEKLTKAYQDNLNIFEVLYSDYETNPSEELLELVQNQGAKVRTIKNTLDGKYHEDVVSTLYNELENEVPSAKMSNGKYDNKEVLNELDTLLLSKDGKVSQLDKHIGILDDAIVSQEALQNTKLGSSKIVLDRLQKALDKLDYNTLTTEEKAKVKNYEQAINNFEAKINDVSTKVLSDVDLDRLNNMTYSEKIQVFGATPDSSVIQELHDKLPEHVNNLPIPKLKALLDNMVPYYDSLPNEEKQDLDNIKTYINAIENYDSTIDSTVDDYVENPNTETSSNTSQKTDNRNSKKSTKTKSKKQTKKPKVKLTAEGIIAEDIYGKDGIVERIKKIKHNELAIKHYEKLKQKTIEFTENYIKQHIPDGTTPPDIKTFLSKGFTGSNRANYYSRLKAKKLISIYDIDRKIESLAKTKEQVVKKIKTKQSTKKAKLVAIAKAIKNMSSDINATIKDLYANGYTVPSIDVKDMLSDSKDEVVYTAEELRNDPTKLIDALHSIYKLESKEVGTGNGNKKITISYNSIVDQKFNTPRNIDGSTDKTTDIFALAKSIKTELDLYNSLLNIDNEVTVPHEINREKEKYDKKHNSNKEENTQSDIEVVTKRLEVEELEDKIYQLKQEIEANNKKFIKTITVDGKVTEAKISAIEKTILDSSETMTESTKQHLEYLTLLNNKLKELKAKERVDKKEVAKLERELKTLEGKSIQLQDKLFNLNKEVHKLTNNHSKNLKIRETTIQKLRTVYKNLWNYLGKLVNGSGKILKDMVTLNKQIKEKEKLLETKKKELDNSTKNIENFEKEYSKTTKKIIKLFNKDTEVQYDELQNFNDSRKKALKKQSRNKRTLAVLTKRLKRLKTETSTPNYTKNLLLRQKYRAGNTPMSGGKIDTKAQEARLESGIPLKFEDFAQTKKKGTSLLGMVPVNMIESKTLTKITNEAVKFFKDIELDVNGKKLKNYIDFRQPGTAFILDDKGNIDKNVATAVFVATYTTLRNQLSKLSYKEDEQIASMLGKNEYEITDEMRNTFKNLTTRASLANDIGTSIMDLLDLQAKPKDGDIAAYNRFKSGLGLLGVAMLEERYMDNVAMSLEEYAEKADLDIEITDKNKDSSVNFLKFKKDTDKDILKETIDIIDELEEDTIIPQDSHSIQFEKPRTMTPEEIGIKDNSVTIPTQTVADAINNLNQQENYLIPEAMDWVKKVPKEQALKLMGWRDDVDIDNDVTLSEYDKSVAKAQNLGITRAYDELLKLDTKITSGVRNNSFYFTWFTPKNNRLNGKSVLIDQQNEKEAHRWLTVPVKSRSVLNKAAIDKDVLDTIGFKFGIAQAFGLDIDKEIPQDTIDFATDLLTKDMDELFKLATEISEDGKKNIDHFGHAMQALAAIEAYKNAGPNDNFEAHISAEFDGVTNGVMIKSLQIPLSKNIYELLVKGGFVFKDTDNSGLYQTGVSYDDMLKDGMLTQLGESNKSRKNGEEGKVLDIYFSQGIIAEISKEDLVNALLENKAPDDDISSIDPLGLLFDSDGNVLEDDLFMQFLPDIDEGLTKALRDLLKNPTMTTQYGSSLKTVIKNIGKATANKAISKLLKDYHNTEDIDLQNNAALTLSHLLPVAQLNETLNIDTIDDLVLALGNTPLHMLGTKKNNLDTVLTTMFQNSLGKAVSKAVESTFGEMIKVTDAVNVTSRYMMRIFEQAMTKKVEEKLEELNKNNTGKRKILTLSQDETLELTKELAKFLPIFDGPASSDRLKDGIFIFDSGLAKDDDIPYSDNKPALRYTTSSGESRTISTKIFIKKITEAYSAAGVIPTHTEDAVTMAKTINDNIDKTGIIPVHDALVLGASGQLDTVKSMNTNFIETSKAYDNINSMAKGARAVYEEAKNLDYINLDDMRTESEKKQSKKTNENGDEEYVTKPFLDQVVELEQLAEDVWIKRQEMFSHDVVVDQFPAMNSAIESKATYNIDKFIEEGELRIKRRLSSINNIPELQALKTKKARQNYLKSILSTNGIKDTKQKIEYNIEIIKILTKVLDGNC